MKRFIFNIYIILSMLDIHHSDKVNNLREKFTSDAANKEHKRSQTAKLTKLSL